MRTRILIASFVSAFVVLTSCNKEKADETPEITQDDVAYSAKTDAAVDDASSIVLEQFSTDAFASRLDQNSVATPAPSCAQITRIPAIGTALKDGDKVTKTIDYGTTTGCTLPNGNVLKGKIIISFYYHPNATSHEITYTFENFYHNEIKLDGTRTITIKIEPNTITPKHLAFYINLNVTVTLPNGKILKITGNKKREIILGENTPLDPKDNVYSVTGSWETVFPNGAIRTATITSPLIIKVSCPNIVKGIITFTRENKTATLDYGNGDCDHTAILTKDGISYTIILKK